MKVFCEVGDLFSKILFATFAWLCVQDVIRFPLGGTAVII